MRIFSKLLILKKRKSKQAVIVKKHLGKTEPMHERQACLKTGVISYILKIETVSCDLIILESLFNLKGTSVYF